jgi:hypothetical protein
VIDANEHGSSERQGSMVRIAAGQARVKLGVLHANGTHY